MEVLLALLAELLIGAIVAAATLTVQLVVMAIEIMGILAALISGYVHGNQKQPSTDSAESDRPRRPAGSRLDVFPRFGIWKYAWVRLVAGWSAIISSIVLALSLLALFIVNLFFFDTCVRWQLARVQQKSGIDVEFESASGSFWTGRMSLDGVSITRAEHVTSTFDLRARRFSVDLSIMELLQAETVIEDVSVEGLRGTFQRVAVPKEFRPRRPFQTNRLCVTDAELTVIDHTRGEKAEVPLEIEEFICAPFRSRLAVFDVLFRSKLTGSFAGSPIRFESYLNGERRETNWELKGLPIELAGPYVGGPMDWIEHGELDMVATDEWAEDDDIEIEMHYEIVLHDIVAAVPEDASPLTKVVARPTVALLNKHPARLPLSFDLRLAEDDFQFHASPLASRLGRDIGRAINDELVDKLEDKKDGLKEKIRGFFDFGDDDQKPGAVNDEIEEK